MVWNRYRRYLEALPETVLEWHDRETGARGWLVLNSRRGGAAGGGTRMRAELTREEVVYLSKAMELKFAFSGPPIGGAKAGIAFDPSDPRRGEVLDRWFRAILPFLATCYGTGGDVNVDEQRDVVPTCRRLGLRHPQEGVVRGHIRPGDEGLERIVSALDDGLREPVSCSDLGLPDQELTVSDLITGYGVARAVRRLYQRAGRELTGTRAVVEGFGNVGGSAALHLARMGARVVAVVDARGALVREEGLEAPEVEELLRRRDRGALPPEVADLRGADRATAYRTPADLFVPAAISGSVDAGRLDALEGAGIHTVVCGANQPFREARLGDTRIQERADRTFAVLPDVVGSMGMARAFNHLMSTVLEDGGPAPTGAPVAAGAGGGSGFREIFEAVGGAMDEAVDQVVERADGPGGELMAAALSIALDRSGRG